MDITRRKWLWYLAAAWPVTRLLAQQKLTDGYRGEFDTYRKMWGRYYHIVNASTNQQAGVPFRLSTAVLRFGLNDRYRGSVSFRASDAKAVLPSSYQFGRADDEYESHSFEVTLNTPGQHTISVRDESTGIEYPSNRIVVSEHQPKQKLYFGDPHMHSGWSMDARGTPDYSYIYARDAMNLDFASLTEHEPSEGIWKRIEGKAGEFYQPGRFATLLGFEWSGDKVGAGNQNVYYRDLQGPIFRSNALTDLRYRLSADSWDAFDLWAKLRQGGESGKTAMTIPHHPKALYTGVAGANTATDAPESIPWNDVDPEFQRLAEIYSSRGNLEYAQGPRQVRSPDEPPRGHFIQDGLAAGQRIGFVAGSDSHSGRPGYAAHGPIYFDSDYENPETELYSGGITGVYAEELTREAIFDAMRDRRCYATTGVRIVVDFRADGHWMGSEYQTNAAPTISVQVLGTAPIESVTLVKNNADYYTVQGNGPDLQFEFNKTETPKVMDVYYLRVIQADGEMAWASPIWISRA